MITPNLEFFFFSKFFFLNFLFSNTCTTKVNNGVNVTSKFLASKTKQNKTSFCLKFFKVHLFFLFNSRLRFGLHWDDLEFSIRLTKLNAKRLLLAVNLMYCNLSNNNNMFLIGGDSLSNIFGCIHSSRIPFVTLHKYKWFFSGNIKFNSKFSFFFFNYCLKLFNINSSFIFNSKSFLRVKVYLKAAGVPSIGVVANCRQALSVDYPLISNQEVIFQYALLPLLFYLYKVSKCQITSKVMTKFKFFSIV